MLNPSRGIGCIGSLLADIFLEQAGRNVVSEAESIRDCRRERLKMRMLEKKSKILLDRI